jgi:hypothetical protein
MLEMLLYGTFPPDVNYMAQLSPQLNGHKTHKRNVFNSAIPCPDQGTPAFRQPRLAEKLWATLVWFYIPRHVPSSLCVEKYWNNDIPRIGLPTNIVWS